MSAPNLKEWLPHCHESVSVKTVDVRLLRKKEPASVTEQVVVARVQFSDGSVWQHP